MKRDSGVRLTALCAAVSSFLLSFPVPAAASPDWLDRVDGPAGGDDKATSVAIDGYGYAYVASAVSTVDGGLDMLTAKYDQLGAVVWAVAHRGPAGGDDVPASIAVGPDGFVYVTGYSERAATDLDFATVKYSPDGEELWVAYLNGPESGRDLPYKVDVDDVGNVYVTGSIWAGEIWWDYMTVKYDSGGTELWRGRYDGPWSTCDQSLALTVDDGGNVYVTGCSEDSLTSWDYATIKYAPDGEELWVARYTQDVFAPDCAAAISVDASGNVFVTGSSGNPGGDADMTTVAYGPDGEELWVVRHDAAGFDDRGVAVAAGPRGMVYVAGSSEDADGVSDYVTAAYDPYGFELWSVRYESPFGDSSADAMVVDGLGSVYLTGRSIGAGGTMDMATVKYDESGEERWVELYDGPGAGVDRPLDMAVDGMGAVCVVGESEGVGTGLDAVAMRYSIETGSGCDDLCELDGTLLSLNPPSPNPFSGETVLGFTVPSGSAAAELSIYDVRGRIVRRMRAEAAAKGVNTVTWDGRDGAGRSVAAGVYFLVLEGEGERSTRKVALMK